MQPSAPGDEMSCDEVGDQSEPGGRLFPLGGASWWISSLGANRGHWVGAKHRWQSHSLGRSVNQVW